MYRESAEQTRSLGEFTRAAGSALPNFFQERDRKNHHRNFDGKYCKSTSRISKDNRVPITLFMVQWEPLYLLDEGQIVGLHALDVDPDFALAVQIILAESIPRIRSPTEKPGFQEREPLT